MKQITIGDITVGFPGWKELGSLAESYVSEGTPHQIITLNSLMFNMCLRDPELKTCLRNASKVLPDSIGILFASYLFSAFRCGMLRRLPGIDIMTRICALAQEKSYKVFFVGARPDVIPDAVLNFRKMFPGLEISGYHHGYFDEKGEYELIDRIKAAKPDILFVGLEIPFQEKWISKNLAKFGAKIVMGVGGSFDIISGQLNRAPWLMQITGLEWFFRLLQQPARIKRIKDLPVFTFKVMKKAIVGRW